ncbi:kinase-like protein [Xylariaceae sp. FL0804]|nr:kinase-like protein [Xylariaceae sp. FL0804]
MSRPIAQFFCRTAETPLPDCEFPGSGFQVASGKPRLDLDFLLYPGQVVNVGRGPDNDVSIDHPYVSRKHFIIYAIIYNEQDLDDSRGIQPLIYVRDCHSLEGTRVDGHCVGSKQQGSSPGFLLNQAQVISINPYWEFHVYLMHPEASEPALSELQFREAALFSDQYCISNRILGSGAYGAIHLAVDSKTQKQVVCKIHRIGDIRRRPRWQAYLRRIKEETDLLAKLRHPNLLGFEFAIESSNTLYTFTELATGGDLFSLRMRYDDGLGEAELKLIIRQIVSAIRYLHKRGIAHRDLKPENIFLASGPYATSRVIVGDLGFAKHSTSGRMTSTVGTDTCMAPETYYRETYGLAVDIWALGLISFFLLPYSEMSPQLDVFKKMDQKTISGIVDLVFADNKFSEDCRDFIKSCLSLNPTTRPTAYDTKCHLWFQREGFLLEKKIVEARSGWKPTHLVAPMVRDLDLIQSKGAGLAKSGLQPSPYFIKSKVSISVTELE